MAPPTFWDPQLHAVVDEHREGEPELVAVERPLRFADHDRIEVASGAPERFEERRRLGSARPRQRAGLPDVEVFGNDLAAGGLDQLSGPGDLPIARRLWVLLVLGTHPAVEGETHLAHERARS